MAGIFVKVMGRVLSAEGCQIIRLALIGNAFGDAGMVTLSKSLQVRAGTNLANGCVRSEQCSSSCCLCWNALIGPPHADLPGPPLQRDLKPWSKGPDHSADW